MTKNADHFRFVDFTEHPLVLLVGEDGSADLHGDDSLCKIQVAAILQIIARDLIAEHGSQRCTPSGATPVWVRPDEPLHSFAGTLDRESRVWTDGTGHAWDLTVPWLDTTGETWWWQGRLTSQGDPIMRSDDGSQAQPLGVLRQLRGPISPVTSGGAA